MAGRAGWLVEAAGPLTDAELEQAREAATRTGLFLESCRAPEATATRPTVATAIGLLTGLGILAMTVGLLRSEAAGDLRTLTATGASSRVRRTITAATAAALAFLGAVLGTVGAYTALVATYCTTWRRWARCRSSTWRSSRSVCRWRQRSPVGCSPAASPRP